MMKGYAYSLSILTLLVSAPALSLSDNIKNELMYVDKPWTITSQFKGNGGAISRIGRAFDYGKLLANSPNDCVNFVTRS
ncbi:MULTISPECIES: hypothetical protein [Raoultella]|uniref:hypothetical protein n=1 Tax=Raoultella TaxID=160674 RepID=UPI001F47A420|nr:hypothetical protein [Raoultella terrigena]MCE9897247.1 hypothetical protein [Raoultella terrigena]HDT6527287.1 hypothetical protein [Raoultella ornithinolytica]